MRSGHAITAAALQRPGIADGFYPERQQPAWTWLDRGLHELVGLVRELDLSPRRDSCPLAAIHTHGRVLSRLDDAGLAEQTLLLRTELLRQGMTDPLMAQAFALIRETADRTIGMRHYDSQLTGGWIMAHGRLAEMETGEGKTLTATLAAATAALAGLPVHVITVNEYLVTRDAALMGPVYRALGLSAGAVTHNMDPALRRRAYGCDIVYCTNKQIAFDYLRDRIMLGNDHGRRRLELEPLHDTHARTGRLFLRGLCFAIVDEADSVLIDEARTPLIISRQVESPAEEKIYRQAINYAAKLDNEMDFVIDRTRRRARLSEQGRDRLATIAAQAGGVWANGRQREELIDQALSALFLYEHDRHYLIHDGKVVIIDENTGRPMADRSWEHGLHQMIEIKEGCQLTGRNEQMARLTYQRFFRRYRLLAGMTGTAREVRSELWSVYHLAVERVATHKPSKRQNLGEQVHTTAADKWTAVVAAIRATQAAGRPVLVGTRSVADSEQLSRMLERAGIAHQVLNARQDLHEASIIAQAGQAGRVTVATNMAGRGTDIALGEGVAARGGLHVIITEKNEARRIDRQLSGRCGRQGDPGSFQAILSLDDDLLRHHCAPVVRQTLAALLLRQTILGQRFSSLVIRRAQAARENQHRIMRRGLLRMEAQLGQLLAFSGRLE